MFWSLALGSGLPLTAVLYIFLKYGSQEILIWWKSLEPPSDQQAPAAMANCDTKLLDKRLFLWCCPHMISKAQHRGKVKCRFTYWGINPAMKKGLGAWILFWPSQVTFRLCWRQLSSPLLVHWNYWQGQRETDLTWAQRWGLKEQRAKAKVELPHALASILFISKQRLTPAQNNPSTDHRPFIPSTQEALPAVFFSRLSHVRLMEQILF